jgi:transcriptional regulator with XRE-family HTH domain
MLRSKKTSFDGRFYVELTSRQALVRQMIYQDVSVAKLARMCGVSKSTIGHLRSGGRTTTSPATAKAIEKALGFAPCTLFLPKVEPVASNKLQRRAA